MTSTGDAGHEVLAVVLQVREQPHTGDRQRPGRDDERPGSESGQGGRDERPRPESGRPTGLAVLLWQRGRPPYQGKWALPGGALGGDEDLGASIRRQLAAKVDVRELSHLEQLDTRGRVDRHPDRRVIATAYLGLVPADVDPDVPPDTAWHPVGTLPEMAYDHAAIVRAGRSRLRSKLSYTNLGFALAPPEFTMSQLRGYYAAALGYDVSATNLQRVLVRRGQIEATGRTAPPGPYGGRPAELFRFRVRRLEVTDGFAVLRPPRD